MSTGHTVHTLSLRFQLTLFIRTHTDERELSFDFEAADRHAAGDKVVAIADRLDECPDVLDWQILSVVQIKTGSETL